MHLFITYDVAFIDKSTLHTKFYLKWESLVS